MKQSKTTTLNGPGIRPNPFITQYCGTYVYEGNAGSSMDLQYFSQVEGYVKPINVGSQLAYQFVYQYRDHLGNNRLSYADDDQSTGIHLTIVEESNYDAFGLKHQGYNNVISSVGNSRAQALKYNGKELQEDFGINWYDYGARFYDAAVGRWNVVDPLGENNLKESPYCYVGNNPIGRIDPDGRDWWDVVAGAAIGVATNIIPGSTNLRNSYTPNDAADYNATLKAVDNTAAVAGAGAMILGADEMAAGGTVALAGAGASATGVGAVAGVPAMVGGGAVALKGAITAGAGAMLMSNSAANQKAGYDYGREQSKGSTETQKQSKVEKTKTTEKVGNFTKTTEVRPGKGPGQSRAEYIRYKNADGKTIKNVKDSYDRAGKFQHRKDKPLPK